jgi:pantoate--beta-alanine ligase
MTASNIPEVITTVAEMQRRVRELRAAGRRVGVVPTMGALHDGHLSLVEAARKYADVVVTTIFVNPAQFAPHEDFGKYPRTLQADLEALGRVGCELAFVPEPGEVYPPGYSTYVEPPSVAAPLEGVCRPGHFRGVATVVLKLFNIVPADVACFGQKDFQQALVIRRMVADLNVPIRIEVCPIVREPDGLAMSSRNRYLSPAERERSLALSRALRRAEELVAAGERRASVVREAMQNVLADAVDRLDYATIADPETLEEPETIERPVVALIAAVVGTTRLIDNMILTPPSNRQA